jgi:hypothetical protein
MRIEVESTHFPRLMKWHVHRVLKWIDPRDLEGLESIKVIDDCPDDPEYIKLPRYLMGFLYNGHYSSRKKDQPAQVVLYANDIWFGIPTLLIAAPMTTLRVARTLAHEVGHHLIATRGYIYKPSERHHQSDGRRDPYAEKMADSYAADVINRMLRHLPYKLGNLMARRLSNSLYQWGLADYWAGDYQAAASKQARAETLNPENEDAGQCFRHAMEKLKAQTPSPLTAAERDWISRRYNPTPMSTGRLRLKKGT